MSESNRARMMLDFICDEVDHEQNPSGEDCWYCGGEGETFDCFDGFCLDADIGCADCTRACPECRIAKHARLKAIREAVIKSNDVDIAREWLKDVGRWSEDITPEQIQQHLDKAREALAAEAAKTDAASAGQPVSSPGET